jgi:hypothetical protein
VDIQNSQVLDTALARLVPRILEVNQALFVRYPPGAFRDGLCMVTRFTTINHQFIAT